MARPGRTSPPAWLGMDQRARIGALSSSAAEDNAGRLRQALDVRGAYQRCGWGTETEATNAFGAGAVVWSPWWVDTPLTVSKLATYVEVGAVGASVRMGLYRSDPSTYRPTGATLCDTGALAATAAGAIEGAVAQPLSRGQWWTALVVLGGAITLTSWRPIAAVLATDLTDLAAHRYSSTFTAAGATGLPTVGTLGSYYFAPQVWALTYPD